MKKVVLVTGTSTGLGMQLSVMLAKQGFTTYASMRNLEKQAALLDLAREQGITLQVKQLDVQDPDSVNRCVDEIIKAEGQLDILINNAGAGFVKTTEHASEEEIEWVLDINLKGVIRCTKAVLPHMREKRSGRIINVTSVGGIVGQPFNELYCAAKFAVEGYTESLASYVQPSFGIQFTAVEPGGIHSEFANSTLQQFMSTGGIKEDDYKPVLEGYIGAAQNRAANGDTGIYQSAQEVAQVIIDCLNDPAPPIRMRTSIWAEQFSRLKTQADPSGKSLQKYVIENVLT